MVLLNVDNVSIRAKWEALVAAITFRTAIGELIGKYVISGRLAVHTGSLAPLAPATSRRTTLNTVTTTEHQRLCRGKHNRPSVALCQYYGDPSTTRSVLVLLVPAGHTATEALFDTSSSFREL